MENPHLLESSSPKCAICSDEGVQWNPDHTRCRPCQCRLDIRAQSIIKRTVPEIFLSAPRVADITAYNKLSSRMDIQQSILENIKQRPLEAYFFVGPTGTGKSYLMWALYKEALFKGRNARFITCRELVEALRKEEMRRPGMVSDPQLISKEDLVRNFFGPFHLFIDEWGKASDSEYAYNQLFGIVDYCHNYPSQVVLSVSTNYTKREFEEIYGEAMIRRLFETCNGVFYGE